MQYKKNIIMATTLLMMIRSGFVFSIESKNDYIINNDSPNYQGIYNENPNSNLNADKVTINTKRTHGEAAFANRGAKLTITDSKITTEGSYGYGLHSKNSGSNLNANKVTINTKGTNGIAAFAIRGAKLNITESEITTMNFRSTGIYSKDSGSNLNANKVTINTKGNKSSGALIRYGAKLTITESEITTEGKESHGLYVQFKTLNSTTKNNSENGSIRAFNSNIKTTGIESNAIYVKNLKNYPNIEKSIVEVKGGSLQSMKGDLVRSKGGKIKIFIDNVPKTFAGSGYVIKVLDNDFGIHGSVTLDAKKTKLQGTIFAVPRGEAIVNLNESQLTGKINNGTSISINSTSLWSVTDNSVLSEKIVNDGNIEFKTDGNNFKKIITKNYQGYSGKILFNTHLGDDNSLTDKLVVTGDTSGKTFVKVNNIGGSGALTKTGIELIRVVGKSEGEFIQEGRIVAGSYDYFLKKGDKKKNTNNWYLQSELYQDKIPVSRPESSNYASNLQAANTMFNMTLHQRLGETQYIDFFNNERKAISMWIRGEKSYINSSMSDKQNKSNSDRYMIMLGGDIAQLSSNGTDGYHFGIMVGYGNQHSKARNHYSQYISEGRINGYSTGLYATWYQNQKEKTGFYMDTWVNYNWFNNEVSGQKLQKESYKSKGITASVESGYAFKSGEYRLQNGVLNTFWIQPQVQLTYMGVNADSHTETNGTLVTAKGGNLQSRLGFRTYLYGKIVLNKGKNLDFKPFIETNWIHNSQDFSVAMNNNKNYIIGTRNIGELKVGVELKISNYLHLWGDVSRQFGEKDYNKTRANLGIKYLF